MLDVRGIHTYYGQSHILFDVSLSLRKGEIVGLLGRNGAGKTTTMKSVCGMLRPKEGSILFGGEEVTGRKPYQLVRRGTCYVPDDRRFFADLTGTTTWGSSTGGPANGTGRGCTTSSRRSGRSRAGGRGS